MFWDEKVTVSDQIYEASSPTIRVSRIVGIFPVSVERDESKWTFKWSGSYAFLSFVLGIILLTATYAGFFGDAMVDKGHTIRIKSSTDVYIVFFDITVVELVVIFGIFVTPFHFKTFCSYIECINDADAILSLNDSKQARRSSIITLAVILSGTTLIWIGDLLVSIKINGERVTKQFIVQSYLGFYLTHYIMLVTQYQLWHLGCCVMRRLKRLNQLLKMELGSDGHLKFTETIIYPSLVSELPMRVQAVGLSVINKNVLIRKMSKDNISEKPKNLNLNPDERILKLMRAYLRLCDAVEIQNELLGFVSAVLITGILLQLILSTYGLYVELAGSRQDPVVALMQTVWCLAHLTRLFMIVEPAHWCTVESDNTKDLVCKLLCSTVSEEIKVQLDAFSMALFHRKVEFYASGLAGVDRSLVTSVIGAITTYLVILLQFVKPE